MLLFFTHLFNDVWRKDSGSKGSPENVRELLVQTSDSHLLKVPVWVDDGLSGLLGLGLPCDHADRTRQNQTELLLQVKVTKNTR